MDKKVLIKGSCENCGYNYQGKVTLVNGSFPEITCPNCGGGTYNFDDAKTVESSDKYEGREVEYNKVTFKKAKPPVDEFVSSGDMIDVLVGLNRGIVHLDRMELSSIL